MTDHAFVAIKPSGGSSPVLANSEKIKLLINNLLLQGSNEIFNGSKSFCQITAFKKYFEKCSSRRPVEKSKWIQKIKGIKNHIPEREFNVDPYFNFNSLYRYQWIRLYFFKFPYPHLITWVRCPKCGSWSSI